VRTQPRCSNQGRSHIRQDHFLHFLNKWPERETVTRLLGDLRDKGGIQLKGSNLLIKNKAALEEMVNP